MTTTISASVSDKEAEIHSMQNEPIERDGLESGTHLRPAGRANGLRAANASLWKRAGSLSICSTMLMKGDGDRGKVGVLGGCA
jgi:hypothetical protein